MLAFQSAKRVKKSIFNPIASGINPNIVVIAVKRTGLSLALPAVLTRSNAIFLSIISCKNSKKKTGANVTIKWKNKDLLSL